MEPATNNDETIATIAGWLRAARHIVALTGAGISTESGIPDFRGPQGLWTKDPAAEKRATLQHYLANRDARVQSWRNRLDGALGGAEPNAGHFALVALEGKGRLQALVTQNVDGLHLRAGTSPAILTEIHGTVREYRCMGCPSRGPIEAVIERVRAGEEDPPCRDCGGVLKAATISFGQDLVAEDLARSQEEAAAADLFLAIGTTLTVYPVALMPEIALGRGARLVIINAGETPFDPWAAAVLRTPIGQVLPQIVARV
ncbi:MAG: SIR2 family NAD-dependent protein deacylase [Tepidiformaceae bacterium]